MKVQLISDSGAHTLRTKARGGGEGLATIFQQFEVEKISLKLEGQIIDLLASSCEGE